MLAYIHGDKFAVFPMEKQVYVITLMIKAILLWPP
jgi:hypothetical protein